MTETLLQSLADAVAEAFPELEGRSIAVSEVDPFDNATNIPSLPLAFTALIGEQAEQGQYGGNITLRPSVLLTFVLQPSKYTREDKSETPFFSYYDYEAIRDRVLSVLGQWRTPRNGSLQYISMEVSSDEYSVMVQFRFLGTEKWCPPDPGPDPVKTSIVTRLLGPKGKCPALDCHEEPEDPCDHARNN